MEEVSVARMTRVRVGAGFSCFELVLAGVRTVTSLLASIFFSESFFSEATGAAAPGAGG